MKKKTLSSIKETKQQHQAVDNGGGVSAGAVKSLPVFPDFPDLSKAAQTDFTFSLKGGNDD